MLELRIKIHRKSSMGYQTKPIIRIAKATQASFIVSKLVVEKLGLDPVLEGIMFGIKNKKLHVFKELKAPDNYHLSSCDTNTFRFRSIELYKYLSDYFKIDKTKSFVLEMKEDFTFILL